MSSQPEAAQPLFKPGANVALFVTCLVDLFRPSVGFAAVKLLEEAGCKVHVPEAQTCCGQPAYNSGDREMAVELAKQTVAAFEGFDFIVAPSGSCGGMIKHHYPQLFAEDAEWGPRAKALAARTFELTQFLAEQCGRDDFGAKLEGHATYHDSCSSLREMNVKAAPRQLLAKVDGLKVTEMQETDACCGFGGTFCIKFPDVSNSMAARKVATIDATGADLLLAGDMGCLMNLAGKMQRDGSKVKVRHVAEVLAGMTQEPAIGEPAIGEETGK
ncbi:MAG: (Fe-S)-binding protein [Proteobacteria bacterium]|nr:(Fe-S)-binding protein [Pseudomonadota bacterium]